LAKFKLFPEKACQDLHCKSDLNCPNECPNNLKIFEVLGDGPPRPMAIMNCKLILWLICKLIIFT